MNQYLPNSKFLNPCLAIVILSIGGIGFFPSHSQAESLNSSHSSSETKTIAQSRRTRPTFFEETQDPEARRRRGFRETFLNDALGGTADPLSGTGGVATTVDSLQKVEFNRQNEAGQLRPGQPILPPSFDRTNVIIPSQRGRN
ncbi:hypothetical protein [Microcoleus sp. Pol12B4]|uniref:hypothetical protein n=1 Tax=Microcoleus sp. Pol12B4 TaxID=3055395 RepID=UPI002FD0CFD8